MGAFRWPGTVKDAVALQRRLATLVSIRPIGIEPVYIAGVDASFFHNKVIGAACLFRMPGTVLIDRAAAVMKCSVPYVPGFLSFREGPAIVQALRKLSPSPDVVLFDGQGIAHPRRLGIASHVGVVLDIPSIGCAKSRLVGEFADPGRTKGKMSTLVHQGEKIGQVVRTRSGVRPVFVSPGHNVSFNDSVAIVLQCVGKYRLPEPIRCADRFADDKKRRLCTGSNR